MLWNFPLFPSFFLSFFFLPFLFFFFSSLPLGSALSDGARRDRHVGRDPVRAHEGAWARGARADCAARVLGAALGDADPHLRARPAWLVQDAPCLLVMPYLLSLARSLAFSLSLALFSPFFSSLFFSLLLAPIDCPLLPMFAPRLAQGGDCDKHRRDVADDRRHLLRR